MERPIFLFDVMDTLVTDPFRHALPEFFGLTLDELLDEKHPTAWIEFELGHLTEAEYGARMFTDGRPVNVRRLARHLRAAYAWVDGAEELLAELRAKGFPMHTLSNYPVWYRLIEEKLQLSRYLAWSFVSCKTRIRKPALDAYARAARELNVEPGACVFIDDRQANCDAADRAGMRAIHFQDVPALREELERLGLL